MQQSKNPDRNLNNFLFKQNNQVQQHQNYFQQGRNQNINQNFAVKTQGNLNYQQDNKNFNKNGIIFNKQGISPQKSNKYYNENQLNQIQNVKKQVPSQYQNNNDLGQRQKQTSDFPQFQQNGFNQVQEDDESYYSNGGNNSISNQQIKNQHDSDQNMNQMKNQKNKENKVIAIVQLDIDSGTEVIKIHEGEDLYQISYDFCQRNDLNEQCIQFLVENIQKQIETHKSQKNKKNSQNYNHNVNIEQKKVVNQNNSDINQTKQFQQQQAKQNNDMNYQQQLKNINMDQFQEQDNFGSSKNNSFQTAQDQQSTQKKQNQQLKQSSQQFPDLQNIQKQQNQVIGENQFLQQKKNLNSNQKNEIIQDGIANQYEQWQKKISQKQNEKNIQNNNKYFKQNKTQSSNNNSHSKDYNSSQELSHKNQGSGQMEQKFKPQNQFNSKSPMQSNKLSQINSKMNYDNKNKNIQKMVHKSQLFTPNIENNKYKKQISKVHSKSPITSSTSSVFFRNNNNLQNNSSIQASTSRVNTSNNQDRNIGYNHETIVLKSKSPYQLPKSQKVNINQKKFINGQSPQNNSYLNSVKDIQKSYDNNNKNIMQKQHLHSTQQLYYNQNQERQMGRNNSNYSYNNKNVNNKNNGNDISSHYSPNQFVIFNSKNEQNSKSYQNLHNHKGKDSEIFNQLYDNALKKQRNLQIMQEKKQLKKELEEMEELKGYFHPQISQKSKEIQRNQKIEEALYYDHMRKQKQIQLSNLLKEEQMMNECSFSPYISEESRKIATKQKQKEKIDNIYSPYFEQQFIDKYLNTENIHDKLYHQAAFDEIRKNISNQQKYQKLNPHTPDLGPNKNRQIPEKSQKEHIKRLFQEKKELDDKLELQRNIQNLPYDKVTGQKLYQPLINKNDPIYQKVSKKIDEQDKHLMENLIKNNINSDFIHQVDGSTRPYQQMWELQLRNEFSSTNYPNSIQNLNAKRRCMTPNASTHQKQQILFPNQQIPTTQNTLNISITNNNNNNNNSSRSRSNSHNNNRSSSQSKGNKNKKSLNSARNLFGKNTKSMDENSKDLFLQNDSNRESSKNNHNNKKSAKIITSKSKKSSKKSSQKNSQRNSFSQNSTPNLKIKPQNLFEMENNQQKNHILQSKNIEDDDIVDYDKGDSNSHASSNNEMPMFRQKVKNENRFKNNMVMVSFDTIQPHVKEKLKRLFGGLDSDGDGEISASEIDLSKIDSEELEIIQDILIEMEDEEKTLNFNQFIEKLIQKDLVKDIMRIYNLQTGFTLSTQNNEEEEQQEGQINQSMQQRYGLEYQKKRKEIEDKKQQELLLYRQNQDFLEKEDEINIQGKRNQNKKRELQLNLNNLDLYNEENDFDNNYNVLFNNAQTDRGTYMVDENKQNLNNNIKNSQIIGGLGNEGFTSARYKQIFMESLMNQNMDN